MAHEAGAVPVLDIGGDVGALVVYLARTPPGGELEGCPAGQPDRRFHTGVHARPVGPGGALVPVAVFPSLAEGTYDLLGEGGGATARVEVAGATVTSLDLR
ncbi:MAG TPA: hypothetical protein VFO65_02375 [Acidimicrobiales bacterium]|nr:hypothetical protein [Acidimicrobiales bacterium]